MQSFSYCHRSKSIQRTTLEMLGDAIAVSAIAPGCAVISHIGAVPSFHSRPHGDFFR